MGFLDHFRHQSPTKSGTNLRDALITAAAAKDFATVAKLWNANAQTIRDSFPDWLKCPAEIAGDAAATQRYCEGLFLVAAVFQRSGDETLMKMLTRPDDNPIISWERDLQAARRLVDGGHPADAAELLKATLASTEGARGTAVDRYRPRILGCLGIALYRAGDPQRGAEATRRALALCEEAGDEDGIRAYTGNLDVITQHGEVVFLDADGRERSLTEPVTERVRYEVRGVGEVVPPAAEALHQRGRAAGARKDYNEALKAFTEAATLDPSWPYPIYDRAFTHLLLHDWDAALVDFERTIQLEPRGFFMAFTALNMLQREAQGEFPRGLFLAFSMLERVTDPVQRRDVLRQLVERQPGFARAWLAWAELAEDPPARLEAIERGLAANPDRETSGLLQINKALTLVAAGGRDAAISLLRELVTNPASTFSTEALARDALKRLDVDPASEGM